MSTIPPVQKASVAVLSWTQPGIVCMINISLEEKPKSPQSAQLRIKGYPDATKAIAVLHAHEHQSAIVQNGVRCKCDVVVIRTGSPHAMSPNFSTSRRALSLLRQKPVLFHTQRSF